MSECTTVDATPLNAPPSTPTDLTYIDSDLEITSIHAKAQDVKPGGLFIAIKGFTKDGHDYINQAFTNKAAAVIAQKTISDHKIGDHKPWAPHICGKPCYNGLTT